ncbi:MAG: transcriptional regulator [Gemmatimonadetes bacterium]|nr:transcriptional regulator [Gemmatimonadota bacterium]
MLDRDLVVEKSASIDRCITRIRKVTGGDPRALEGLDVEDICVLNLQRAVQTTIDLASHWVAAENLGVAKTLKETFSLLEQAGRLQPDLAERLRKMVGFRNIAVHDYQKISPQILGKIVRLHLGNLEAFASAALGRTGGD